MILIPSQIAPKKWDSQDAALLGDFLATATGILLLEWLQYYAPELLDGGDVNKTLVRSGQVKGYGEALERIITLTVDQPEEVKRLENYPPIDDESHWNDRDKTPE